MARYMDVLGIPFWLPDPDSVSGLAGDFAAVRDNLSDAESQLQGLRSPGSWSDWSGQAADAFAQRLGQLPGQLSQAHESYATAATALSSYAGAIRPIVDALISLAQEADEAEATLRGANAELENVRRAGDHATITYWETRVQDDTAMVNSLRSRVNSLLDELNGLSTRCTQQIDVASNEGIHNDLATDYERYILMDGGATARDFLKFEADLGKVIATIGYDILVDPFVEFAKDFDYFLSHPSWESLGKTLGDFGQVLALAALLVPGLGEIVAPVLLTALAADVIADATHEKGAGLGQIAQAALGLGLLGMGHVLDEGVAADDGLIKSADGDEAKKLLNGTDARASGTALLKAGIKQTFSKDEIMKSVQQTDIFHADFETFTKDDPYSLIHLGKSASAESPAAVLFRRINFVSDAGQDVQQVYGVQHQKG